MVKTFNQPNFRTTFFIFSLNKAFLSTNDAFRSMNILSKTLPNAVFSMTFCQ